MTNPVPRCVVEIRKGSRNKYEWDPDLRPVKVEAADRFARERDGPG
jgi:inorganic pyrophosphatase